MNNSKKRADIKSTEAFQTVARAKIKKEVEQSRNLPLPVRSRSVSTPIILKPKVIKRFSFPDCTKIKIQNNQKQVIQHFKAYHKHLPIPTEREMIFVLTLLSSTEKLNRHSSCSLTSSEIRLNMLINTDHILHQILDYTTIM